MKVKNKELPPKIYREKSDHKMPLVMLSDEVYSKAMRSMVVVCTDAIVVDRLRRTVWLAYRNNRPMRGYWVIGGRMMADEGYEESVRRCFRRETGLNLSTDRFEFLLTSRQRWSDRAQTPHNVGSDTESHTFAVELSAKEREVVNAQLESVEYVSGSLKEFTREELTKLENPVQKLLVELYDAVFDEVA